jgi:predicted type IV restriction endonuclease
MSGTELADLVDSIKKNLTQGRYQNESAIREAVVLPVLQALHWNTLDPSTVRREYPLASRRVDYCLFVHPSIPDVLVEVKATGLIEGGDRQLFEYAFHEGVPMALLTDGREWSFYLPAGQGSYNDRRVYKLDFLERSTDECCRVLIRYLAFDRVKSKDSIADARKDYETASQERTAADNLYPAWKKLVEEGDDLLIELLIEKTQTLCGYGPTPEQATKFLTSLFAVAQQPKTQTKVPQSSAPAQTNPPINATVSDENKGGKTRVLIDGKSQDARDAINGLIMIIKHLASQDQTFMERLEVRARGRSRHYVARSPQEVYPYRPDLVDNALEILPGWYLDTNISNKSKLNIVRHACDVAGRQFGKDIGLATDN